MKTISKGRLKAQMLASFREVEATGEPLIVTDRGREVLEVRPYQKDSTSTKAVLAAYRVTGSNDLKIPSESELLAPEAESDWDALGVAPKK